jgi:hypothetical protein
MSLRGAPRRQYYRPTEGGAAGARIALRAAEASRLKAAERLGTPELDHGRGAGFSARSGRTAAGSAVGHILRG